MIAEDTTGETDGPLWNEDFINSYIQVADQHSHDNARMHLGLSLALVGEALRDCTFKNGEETCRVHPLVLQASGSGKDSAFDVAEDIAKKGNQKLGDETSFRFYSVDNITSGSLAGRKVEGGQQKGVVDRCDILGVREAKELFTHPKKRRHLRILMDEGEVTREMRDGTVSTESSSTVIGTAPPREIDANKVSELVSEGTLARFLYFYKHVGVTDTRDTIRQILAETSCDNDREHSISEQEQERLKQRLSATLAQIAEHYAGGIDFEVELTEQMLSRTVEQKITATLDRHAAGVQESIKPMLTRYTIHALRIACIMAALDKCSSKVQEKHLEQAMPYWGESFSSMLEYFADRQDEISGVNRQAMKRQRDKADDKLELLIRILQKPGIRQAKTVEELDSSRETIREHAKELEERDVIKIKRTGNSAKYLPKNNRDEDPLANYM